jgi:sensor histidine kinase YesM
LRFTEKSSFSALISLLFHSVLKYISLSLYLLSFLFPSVDRGKALERQREREREREKKYAKTVHEYSYEKEEKKIVIPLKCIRL